MDKVQNTILKIELRQEQDRIFNTGIREQLLQNAVNEYADFFEKCFNDVFGVLCTFVELKEHLELTTKWRLDFKGTDEEEDGFFCYLEVKSVNLNEHICKTVRYNTDSFTVRVENRKIRFFYNGKNPIQIEELFVEFYNYICLEETVSPQPTEPTIERIENALSYECMTLLDYFAGIALPIVVNERHTQSEDARNAYEMAAEMLKARLKYLTK